MIQQTSSNKTVAKVLKICRMGWLLIYVVVDVINVREIIRFNIYRFVVDVLLVSLYPFVPLYVFLLYRGIPWWLLLWSNSILLYNVIYQVVFDKKKERKVLKQLLFCPWRCYQSNNNGINAKIDPNGCFLGSFKIVLVEKEKKKTGFVHIKMK